MGKKRKGLFLINECLVETSGISKKIKSQYEAFLSNKIEMELCYLEKVGNLTKRKVNKKILNTYSNNSLGKLKIVSDYNEIYKYIVENEINFIYIRYTHFSNLNFLRFLKKIKSKKIKILLEIPTYPYDLEYKNRSKIVRLYHFYEKITRNYFFKYIDKIITFSNDDFIFGCTTIKLSNGIDIEKIFLKKEKINKKAIDFLGVARLESWHGYDRLIKSIANLDSELKEKVFFHIVGDGKISQELKILSKKLNLENNVIFYGEKSGKELDEIFDNCNVGVDSLARHRSGNNENSSLKSKEYVARGIPLIKSHKDMMLENHKFVYSVSSDENIFDLNHIIEWFKSGNFNSKEIREYAVNNFDWKIQMKIVIDNLNDKME